MPGERPENDVSATFIQLRLVRSRFGAAYFAQHPAGVYPRSGAQMWMGKCGLQALLTDKLESA